MGTSTIKIFDYKVLRKREGTDSPKRNAKDDLERTEVLLYGIQHTWAGKAAGKIVRFEDKQWHYYECWIYPGGAQMGSNVTSENANETTDGEN